LVLSFFKGSLDLLEGIFVHDLGIRCARFDGDLGPAAAKQELDHFRKRPSTKILLATVQSGGTGLNIIEAVRESLLFQRTRMSYLIDLSM
jgi:SNF2 family DNA or RNA helicase